MELPERSNFWFPIIKNSVGLVLKLFSRISIEAPKDLKNSIKDKNIYHVSLHKSMFETISLPYSIRKIGGEIPYILAGDNLFEGTWKKIMDNCGVLTTYRSGGKREVDRIVEPLVEFGEKNSLLIFPEGTRTRTGIPGKFKTTAFHIALQASKERDTIILCSNHDYTKVKEENDYITHDPNNNTPYSFEVMDAFGWVKPLGHIIVSFDELIQVDPKMDRKDLSDLCQRKCLDLVKILPKNVYAEGMRRLNESDRTHNRKNIEYFIDEVLDSLWMHEDKFRYFSPLDNSKDILRKVKHFEDPRLHELYSGYIRHYLKR